jgi:hypothetical protein
VTIPVLGLGLVSCVATTALGHVFFPRADAPPPWPSPFVGADDRPIDASYAPWAGPLTDLGKRIVALACIAADEALAPIEAVPSLDLDRSRIQLFVCLPVATDALPEETLAAIAAAIGRHVKAHAVQRFAGAAGAFQAIDRFARMSASNEATAAILVGADSSISEGAIAARVITPPSPFLPRPVGPGEGAGALLLTTSALASRWRVAPIGELTESRSLRGRSTDDDDEVVDGATMTALVADLPRTTKPIASVFGQTRVDVLRVREWESTVARHAPRFDSSYYGPNLEVETGRVGAAAGMMNVAFAIASLRHGTTPIEATAPAPFAAWAISRDGTRGIGLGLVARADAESGVLLALSDRARARRLDREPVGDTTQPTDVSEDLDVDAIPEDFVPEGEDDDLEPANDIAPLLPALPDAPEATPLVRLDPARARQLTKAELDAIVVAHAGEAAGALSRDRQTVPLQAVQEIERRLLCQLDAIAATGRRALVDLATWWASVEEDPFRASAAALSALTFDGSDAANLVFERISALDDDALDHAALLPEALALSDHPELVALSRKLHRAPTAIARAVGLTALGARAQLVPEDLRRALADAHPAVVRAAIWSCEPLPPGSREGVAKTLRDKAFSGDEALAWSAARVLTMWRDRDALAELESGRLMTAVGKRGLELLVLAGTQRDVPKVGLLVASRAPDAATLDAIGRFGFPTTAPILYQQLSDDDLAEDAASALSTMFGAIVEPSARLDQRAWRRAVSERAFDPATRYRRGHPWSPSLVADECESGVLDRIAVDKRADELIARVGMFKRLTLAAWWPTAEASARDFFGEARGKSAAAAPR